jgi:carbon monoxide dehydrogenase subunit G
MELSNEFTVAVPVDEAWRVITDLERIAPCMPGAQLQEVEGDEYRGVVKIKVGPITAQYKGVATFLEQDPAAHRAVLKAEGRDTRGQGNASATITAQLVSEGDALTRITVDTDLTITGKVAQFGRGVLADVSTKLIGQFADSLNAELTTGAEAPPVPGPAAEATPEAEPPAVPAPAGGSDASVPSGNGSAPAAEEPAPPASGPRTIDSKPAEPIDLLGHAGSPVAKRVGPIVGFVVVVLWLLRRRTKKRK